MTKTAMILKCFFTGRGKLMSVCARALQELVRLRAEACGHRGGSVRHGEVHHQVPKSVSQRNAGLSFGYVRKQQQQQQTFAGTAHFNTAYLLNSGIFAPIIFPHGLLLLTHVAISTSQRERVTPNDAIQGKPLVGVALF